MICQVEQLLDLECEAQVKRISDQAAQMQQQLREKAAEAKALLLDDSSKENVSKEVNMISAIPA